MEKHIQCQKSFGCLLSQAFTGYSDKRGRYAFTSLEDISEIVSLKELVVFGQINLSSTKGIEKLINLTKIDLHDSGITSLTGIEELTKLEEINLSNTNLYDNYVNENTKETKKTLQVLGNLNYKKNGSLKRLYMSGVSKIIDWEEVSNLSWVNKSGF